MDDLGSRWRDVAALLVGTRDVLDARPEEGTPPALDGRGWAPFLLALDDDQLAILERDGLAATWPGDTPASLRALVADASAACAMASLTHDADRAGLAGAAMRARARRHERPRKQAQIDAFAQLILPLASRATRVLDVGSGHGHLTREIAERVALPVVGLERNAALTERARELTGEGASPSFAVRDVLDEGIALASGDCVIGLHACGELGDAVVTSVAAARGPSSMALVGCCLQKQRAPVRRPLGLRGASVDEGSSGRSSEGLALPKALLGLSNLTMRDDGVEASLSDNLAARARRLALHRLLASALGPSAPLRFGAEIEGVNRRAAHLELPALVERAFAHRGLTTPSAGAIVEAAAWARAHHARMRRLQLPRTMLARLLEVFVLLDRAAFLAERGFTVEVGAAFPPSVSARNLALLAWRGAT